MFGLVNKGLEDMICSQYGEEIWEKIKSKAEVEIEAFISMDSYPDDITYRLVDAASVVMAMPATDILEAFGRYWLLFTATEGFGSLMEMAGDNLPEFLQNLDNLHARVGLSFPELQPPSFLCSHLEAESLKLHYYSERPGLTPMVVGMLKGLGEKFDTDVDIQLTNSKDRGNDHQELSISHKLKCPFKPLFNINNN
ncbi:heme NO-binding domain-containing protein [Chamaesiphon minutus]|uniref:Heme NO binding protein n=1 Tax=Chamaesiphon minutus (strain ATCC 27169 / PCC 6605) TaxID=1173020 RepID=K9UD61_CHAP6|nr:heme NO-binding domain-containing protein [Chamaesiphon minutus]AFY92149.1 heme NO binding protein [Chamaesiphon minutus PCC 6605]